MQKSNTPPSASAPVFTSFLHSHHPSLSPIQPSHTQLPLFTYPSFPSPSLPSSQNALSELTQKHE